jgi:hypothetical protein
MRYFIEKCIPPRANSKGAGVGERWFDEDTQSDLAEAVVIEEPDTWWLVRFYYPRKGRSYFLLHCVGPAEYIKKWALPAMVSFRPL